MPEQPDFTLADTVTFADITAAAGRLSGVARHTPVLTSRTVDARTGARVFFKCENFQRSGAFKFRGAYNALALLPNEQKQKGVLTYSSGNHAGALALAGKLLGIPTTVIMPEDAPRVKLEATRSYGAEVILYDKHETTREALGQQLSEERGLPIIPPYDSPDVIAGQGTTAMELIEEVGALDLLLMPCGGGGLLSGSAIAAKALAPEIRVVGVEPETADDAARSFHSGVLQRVENPDTIADGARTPSLGQYTFPLVMRYVDDIVTVSDEALVRTLRLVWERMKIVVEPTAVLAVAALLEGVVSAPGRRVGVVLSAGNVDFAAVLPLFQKKL
ncbi:MAG TPA: threo-3-hydroxy-L-aspartate ammonia-lyase [Rhodothermales bacterium]|nr:threo-3-hydroxy-L-aspartate ammonia-lyase [Rhodothermales bacterium]